MDIIGIFLSQMGVSKDEMLTMAKTAASTVQDVDARMTRMENTLNAIAAHLGVEVNGGGNHKAIEHDSES